MKGRVKFEIDNSEPGAIRYREGWKEYRFPFFEENGETVFVAEPTLQRLFLFFWSGGWTWVPTQLETAERERITQRVSEYLSRKGARVRVMSRDCSEAGCQFHPELFEARNKAADVLKQAGFSCLQDYGSIDLLHADYGLEVCGIVEEPSVERIAEALRDAFPQWHFGRDYLEDTGREPGWRFAIYMFSRCCPSGACGGSE